MHKTGFRICQNKKIGFFKKLFILFSSYQNFEFPEYLNLIVFSGRFVGKLFLDLQKICKNNFYAERITSLSYIYSPKKSHKSVYIQLILIQIPDVKSGIKFRQILAKV